MNPGHCCKWWFLFYSWFWFSLNSVSCQFLCWNALLDGTWGHSCDGWRTVWWQGTCVSWRILKPSVWRCIFTTVFLKVMVKLRTTILLVTAVQLKKNRSFLSQDRSRWCITRCDGNANLFTVVPEWLPFIERRGQARWKLMLDKCLHQPMKLKHGVVMTLSPRISFKLASIFRTSWSKYCTHNCTYDRFKQGQWNHYFKIALCRQKNIARLSIALARSIVVNYRLIGWLIDWLFLGGCLVFRNNLYWIG